jgi:CDP-diacylglycerol--serine O-phosphatidyltransferase
MLKHLPNFLTCCNLLCGCFAIIFLVEGEYRIIHPEAVIPAAYFVWAACVFDFFDGFVARLLKFSSPIGKELDSLADMVSFGLLPSLVMYFMLDKVSDNQYVPYIAFLIAVCSALRLAIFNVDETQKDSFRGVPTPANALFITSLPLVTISWLSNEWVLVVITLVFSLLMVSRIELFALKFKNFTWSDNKIRFTFIVLAVLLVAVFQLVALPLIILSYILLSLGIWLTSRSGS